MTSNQTFTVTPDGVASFEGDADADTGANTNARTYTADVGSATSVNIALVNPDNVTVGSGGEVSFESVGTAAQFGSVGGVGINQLNGTTVDLTSSVVGVSPVNGTVTFRVNANINGFGSAIPVVYVPTGGVLRVDSDGLPTEDFGIGGQVTVLPQEAATADYTGAEPADATAPSQQTVRFVNASQGLFVGEGVGNAAGVFRLFRFSPADTYTLALAETGSITLSSTQFAGNLRVGDVVTADYSVTAADEFAFVSDAPAAPTNVTASLVDVNGDGVNDNVRVSWTNPAHVGLFPDGYIVEQALITDGVQGGWVEVKGEAPNAPTPAPGGLATSGVTLSTDVGIPDAGTYVYRVRAHGGGTAGATAGAFSAASPQLVVPAGQAAFSGFGPSAAMTLGGTLTDANLQDGSIITLNFAENISVASNATVTLVNSIGQQTTIARGGSTATFEVDNTGAETKTLTITLAAPPTVTGPVGSPSTFKTDGDEQVSSEAGLPVFHGLLDQGS